MLSYGRGEEIQPTVFTPEVLARGKELWDRAESAAPDPEVRRRVFAARAPEMCSRLFNAGTRYEVAGGRLAPRPPVDAALRDRFVEAAIAGGAAHLRENDAAPEDFGLNFGRQYEAVVLENERLRAVVVPELGGRIYSIRASGLDVELMRVIDFIRSVNYLPYGAGYEFRLDPAMPGSATEPFDIVERDGSSRLVLRAAFDEALQLDTELTLAADRLHVTHTVANGGRKAVTVSPATHAEWNCDVFGPGVTLDMRKADGTWRSLPVNPEGRPGRELSFAGQELPAGGWRINSPGSPLELEETFDAATVDHVRLAFYLRSSCLDLNLHFKARAIAPGETARFGMTWRFALKA